MKPKTKEQQQKVEEAIKLCQDTFNSLGKIFTKHYGEEKGLEIQKFLLENSYFAGGMFRSIFTDTKINDIDIFFRTEEAVLEFTEMFANNNNIFNSNGNTVTRNGTHVLLDKTLPHKVSFITKSYGQPSDHIYTFDFTFNQHYYCLNTDEMHFNIDTFDKKGAVILSLHSKDIKELFRVFRFIGEGFQFEPSSLINLYQDISRSVGGSVEDSSSLIDRLEIDISGLPNGNVLNVRLTGRVITEI